MNLHPLKKSFWPLAIVVNCVLPVANASAYTATSIGASAVNTSPVGGSSKYADINQNGRVVWTHSNGSSVWVPGTGRVDLTMSVVTNAYPQTTDYRGHFASAINDSNIVVGAGDVITQQGCITLMQTRGCSWSPSGNGYGSPTMHSADYYGAVGFDGINNSNLVVASFAWHEQYDHHVETYDGSDYTTNSFPGGAEGMQGVGINDAGQVVGTCWDLVVDYYPYVTNYNAFVGDVRLGYIAVSGSSSGESFGNAVNEYGIAVGEWTTDVSPRRAFIWIPDSANGTTATNFAMKALGELTGETSSVAFGVGNVSVDGQGVYTVKVVGTCGNKAVLWTVQFEPGDSNSFSPSITDLSGEAGAGITLTAAFDINDDGDIAAGGTSGGSSYTYLLEP
ncbi:MAG: hypothetical protein AB1705_25755 [Verrucomicrobiota bacterium]